ncbi:putative hydrolase LipZ [Clavelina lepadiformis]|uniref:putative hydrolase LipZ n=1 Tax=Clavelina lepadiformis TaxID=159417 RepID=UPI0040412070
MGWKLHLTAVLTALVCVVVYLPDPPYVTDVRKLSTDLQKWHERGETIKVNGHNVFYIYEKCKNEKLKNPPTFAILHGYPSSSYEYHKVIDALLEVGDVFIHDHVGFGFSDKPAENFTYSMSEAADNALVVWRSVKISRAHVVAHDMGDTVLTEILARRYRGLLPNYFDNFFQSVTFTNGGMKYSLISFRLSQIILPHPTFGPFFSMVGNRLGFDKFFMKKQIASIWSPHANKIDREREIGSIAELNEFKGGFRIFHKNIYYLYDRAHFEFRWFAALAEINIPIRFIWGDSDAVAPISIPKFFQSFVPEAELILIPKGGHFWMLEQPDVWIKEIRKVLK